jgi:hypothetical protein
MDTVAWVGGALWLGLLTAISPCPLASNLAAIGFLGRHASPRRVLAGGLLYTAGRSLAYIALGLLLAWGLLGAPGFSGWLQRVLAPLLGPLLVLVGMVMLGWLPCPFGGGVDTQRWQRLKEDLGFVVGPAHGRRVRAGLLPAVRGAVLRQPAAAGGAQRPARAGAAALRHRHGPARGPVRRVAGLRGPPPRPMPSGWQAAWTAGCALPPACS